MAEIEPFVVRMVRATRSIFGEAPDESFWDLIRKQAEFLPQSNRISGTFSGWQDQPYYFLRLVELHDKSIHHKTCLKTKANALTGLGFREPRVTEALDPLTSDGVSNLLQALGHDYWATGNAYIEVIRDAGGQILALHHQPAHEVFVVLEDSQGINYHYAISPTTPGTGQVDIQLRWARFGDRDDFVTRLPSIIQDRSIEQVSELIHFHREKGTISRWYGIPDWIAAVPYFELEQMAVQHYFDFFNNRGVPEFMLFFLGGNLDKDTRTAIETAMGATIGQGNQHKSVVASIPSPNIQVQLERLAGDTKPEGMMAELMDTIAHRIVTAHQVPPLLAGILIPGKLGASNEFVNALQSFQLLTIGPEQVGMSATLANTLGDPTINGGVGLTAVDFQPPEDILEPEPEPAPKQEGVIFPQAPRNRIAGTRMNGFNTILEQIDLGKSDTISKMRQPLPEAQAQGRDLSAGPKKRGSE